MPAHWLPSPNRCALAAEVPAVAARPQSPHRPRLKQRRRSFDDATATLVLGNFGRDGRKPPPAETVEVWTWPPHARRGRRRRHRAVSRRNVRRASATVVLGHFGGDKTPPAPTVVEEVVDLPPLALDEPASDLEDQMFAGASATVVLGNFGSSRPPPHQRKWPKKSNCRRWHRDEAAPANADTLPQPGTEAFDNAATVVLRQFTTPEPAPVSPEDALGALEFAPLDLADEVPGTGRRNSCAGRHRDHRGYRGNGCHRASEETPEALPDSAVELPAIVDLDTSDARSAEAAAAVPPAEEVAVASKLNISPTLYEIFMEEARGHLATLQARIRRPRQRSYSADRTPDGARRTYAGGHIRHGRTRRPEPARRRTRARCCCARDITDQADNLAAIEILRQTIAALDEMIADVGMQEPPPQAAPHLIAELAEIYPLPAQTVVEDIQGSRACCRWSSQPIAAPTCCRRHRRRSCHSRPPRWHLDSR